MTVDTLWLCGAAASIGLVHTLLGPDHYLPFVAMSRAGRWSLTKTVAITLLCGLGHVLGSVALGVLGLAVGAGVFRLEAIERFRGDVAGWLLLAFGLVYLVWGVRRAIRNRPHTHCHVHADGTAHAHQHVHTHDHLHVHEVAQVTLTQKAGLLTPPYEAHKMQESGSIQDLHGDSTPAKSVNTMTPWVLFTIFLFGPCEPLIPLLMYPAAKGDAGLVVWVTAIFAVTTLGTMITAVVLSTVLLRRVRTGSSHIFAGLERYSHALAGLTVTLCGAAVQFGL